MRDFTRCALDRVRIRKRLTVIGLLVIIVGGAFTNITLS